MGSKISRRYAKALLSLGQEDGQYAEYGQNLQEFAGFCSDNEELKDWFRFILTSPATQEVLMASDTQEQFADMLMELSVHYGFNFPREALDETLGGSGIDHFSGLESEDPWVHKLLQMRWSPLGYSR